MGSAPKTHLIIQNAINSLNETQIGHARTRLLPHAGGGIYQPRSETPKEATALSQPASVTSTEVCRTDASKDLLHLYAVRLSDGGDFSAESVILGSHSSRDFGTSITRGLTGPATFGHSLGWDVQRHLPLTWSTKVAGPLHHPLLYGSVACRNLNLYLRDG